MSFKTNDQEIKKDVSMEANYRRIFLLIYMIFLAKPSIYRWSMKLEYDLPIVR